MRILSREEIIKVCEEKHGKKYNYSLVKDSLGSDSIPIICDKHGIFKLSVNSHKRGARCPVCHPPKLSNEEVIEQFKKANNNQYIYDITNYTSNQTKVEVICKKHGVFTTSPDNHKRGNGCPDCAIDKIYKNKPTYLYHLSINNNGKTQYKLGVCLKRDFDTVEEAVNYRYSYEKKHNVEFHILDYKLYDDGVQAYKLEQAVINELKDKHIPKNESIMFSGYTEIFNEDFISDFNLF